MTVRPLLVVIEDEPALSDKALTPALPPPASSAEMVPPEAPVMLTIALEPAPVEKVMARIDADFVPDVRVTLPGSVTFTTALALPAKKSSPPPAITGSLTFPV